MSRILFLLTLKPILYGLIGMIISGLTFPVTGVIILRNNLVPMRYMLMHGVILGGIVSIALGLPLLLTVIPLNVILVLIIVKMNKGGHELSVASSATMVCTMGLASLLSHISGTPAKDTLEVLWGSPFALTKTDLAILVFLGVANVVYVACFFREISMIFFDSDIATSLGVNVKFHNTVMLLFTALIISVAMRVLGALLIDALVVLPVVESARNASSLKEMFIRSSIRGFVFSVSGYFIALWFNLPVSGVIAIISCVAFLIGKIGKSK